MTTQDQELFELPLGRNAKYGYAFVDAPQAARLCAYNWSVDKGGYPYGYVDGRRSYLHRVVMGCSYKDGKVVDHINGNKLDNRLVNLRIVTKAQNNMNRNGNRNSTSKYRGVFYHKAARLWFSKIGHNKKYTLIGYFKSEDEAAVAYNQKATELHGEYARLNTLALHKEKLL